MTCGKLSSWPWTLGLTIHDTLRRIYLNEKLAVDVGGLHPKDSARVNLSNPIVQQALELEIGGVYALDIFHAERHTHESNFHITTTLVAGCNIIQSGESAYTWSPLELEQDWKMIGGPTWGFINSSRIQLTSQDAAGSVGYAYLRQQVNMGTGFQAKFSFEASTESEGFVFTIQKDIVDPNGGSGGNLGFKNTRDAVGVAFDFCADRQDVVITSACKDVEVRLHYEDTGGLVSARRGTQRLRAPILFPYVLNDGKNHTVEINYYYQSPDWLEVLVDDDLFLQKRGIDLEQVTKGRNAFVGFTASTGLMGSEIFITDFAIKTVAIETGNTKVLTNSVEPQVASADGNQVVHYNLKTYDFCGHEIEFGGSSRFILGILTNENSSASSLDTHLRRRLAMGHQSPNATTTIGNVRDHQNGEYSVEFATSTPGNYSLMIWFGKDCFENGSLVHSDDMTNKSCFFFSRPNAAVFSHPNKTDEEFFEYPDGPSMDLTGLGVAFGVILLCGMCCLLTGLLARRKWRKEKRFIEAGKLANAEKDVKYTSLGRELDRLQARYQKTLEQLQHERARSSGGLEQNETLNMLLHQRDEIKSELRRLRERKQQGEEDIDQTRRVPVQSSRRKSFAPQRPALEEVVELGVV